MPAGGINMNRQDLLNKGFQRFAERDYERAIVLFRKVLEIDDQFEAAYSALSEALNRTGQIDEAIPVVKRWLEINPKDPMAHAALSRLYVQKGMLAEAEQEMAASMRLSTQK